MTNPYAMNASGVPLGSLFASSYNVVIIIALTVLLYVVLMVLISNQRVLAFLLGLKKKLRYTMIGIITAGLGFVFYIAVDTCAGQVRDGNPVILKVITVVIVSFVSATLLGWLVDKYFIQRVKKAYAQARKKK